MVPIILKFLPIIPNYARDINNQKQKIPHHWTQNQCVQKQLQGQSYQMPFWLQQYSLQLSSQWPHASCMLLLIDLSLSMHLCSSQLVIASQFLSIILKIMPIILKLCLMLRHSCRHISPKPNLGISNGPGTANLKYT